MYGKIDNKRCGGKFASGEEKIDTLKKTRFHEFLLKTDPLRAFKNLYFREFTGYNLRSQIGTDGMDAEMESHPKRI
jgi:hypothetical protein